MAKRKLIGFLTGAVLLTSSITLASTINDNSNNKNISITAKTDNLVMSAAPPKLSLNYKHLNSKTTKINSTENINKFIKYTGTSPIYSSPVSGGTIISQTIKAKGTNYTPLYISSSYKIEHNGKVETWYDVNYSTPISSYNTGYINSTSLLSDSSYVGNQNTGINVNLKTGEYIKPSKNI